ncbi:MAG TPA: hypothetical protein VJ180_12485, partial [Pyrinomonadaceae bacterium]|nr:hypothetical protein [Pyrinomonadaceae bacterium]
MKSRLEENPESAIRNAQSAIRDRRRLLARGREIAPAITPLVIGFTLLLGLILLQGFVSIRRTDDVSFRVLDLENTYAARLSLLLKLRLAVTKLDNEARARQEAVARDELKPPFALRLS